MSKPHAKPHCVVPLEQLAAAAAIPVSKPLFVDEQVEANIRFLVFCNAATIEGACSIVGCSASLISYVRFMLGLALVSAHGETLEEKLVHCAVAAATDVLGERTEIDPSRAQRDETRTSRVLEGTSSTGWIFWPSCRQSSW